MWPSFSTKTRCFSNPALRFNEPSEPSWWGIQTLPTGYLGSTAWDRSSVAVCSVALLWFFLSGWHWPEWPLDPDMLRKNHVEPLHKVHHSAPHIPQVRSNWTLLLLLLCPKILMGTFQLEDAHCHSLFNLLNFSIGIRLTMCLSRRKLEILTLNKGFLTRGFEVFNGVLTDFDWEVPLHCHFSTLVLLEGNRTEPIHCYDISLSLSLQSKELNRSISIRITYIPRK